MRRGIIGVLATALIAFGLPQADAQIPVPASETDHLVYIMDGNVHIGDGDVFEKTAVLVKDGKIVYVGPSTAQDFQNLIRNNTTGIDTIDAAGKEVYPGLIALNTTIGLTEIDAVRASRDFDEVGDFNPHVRAVIAYNPESRITPTLRHNGVMMVESAPQGGVISGSSALMNLDGWNWEDAAIKEVSAVHLHWPRTINGQETEIQKLVTEIRTFFTDAQTYYNGGMGSTNLRFEAMKPVFDRKIPVMVHADDFTQISAAVQFAKDFNIRICIVGGRESYKLTTLLRENEVPVIINRTHQLPGNEDDAHDLPFRLPSILQDSGVLFAIADNASWPQRNLPFQAGTAVAYGLSKEAALAAITYNPAKILGMDGSLGTIEVGKRATIVVSEGDILDMRTNSIYCAFVDGKRLDLTNHQEEKFKRYQKKYGN